LNQLLDNLLNNLPEGNIVQVLIGLHWTAVVAEIGGERRCGLASTLGMDHEHHGEPDVPQAGQLGRQSGLALAALARSDRPALASVGMATINALLPSNPEALTDLNAEEVIAGHGAGKEVALIGRFPFVPRLRSRVGKLLVLEQNPGPGDLPTTAADEILPAADVVAITGMTLINHTLDGLLRSCSPHALVILLGPSTPLSPVLFDHGIDIICGSVVTAVDPVLQVVGQGGTFRQVHRAGVRTVTMTQAGYNSGIGFIA
jgi:uncharacterized protein (DUF4213/DUF364 family)